MKVVPKGYPHGMWRAQLMGSVVGVMAMASGGAGCEPPRAERYDYGRPSTPVVVAEGAALLGVAGAARLLQVEDPGGPPGCLGRPEPRLDVIGTAGEPLADGGVRLSAGQTRVLTRSVAGRHLVAVLTSCGRSERLWWGVAEADGLHTGGRLPVPGNVRLTAWGHDGRQVLGVEITAPRLDGHRLVALDLGSGELRPLGGHGYWVGALADGDLVVDLGDRFRVGPATVTLEDDDGTGSRGRVAVSPAGDRVAIGTNGGLLVAAPDGRAPRWATEPVANAPAWSTDGTALAYVTARPSRHGARGASGPLRIATATSAPSTVAPGAAATATGFAAGGATAALVHTALGAGGRPSVAEVRFPRWTTDLPATPAGYAAAALTAWEDGDQVTLARLVDPAVLEQLPESPPATGWPPPECQVVLNQSYCLSAVGDHTVMLRVDDALVAERAEHAVIEVLVDLPVAPVPATEPP